MSIIDAFKFKTGQATFKQLLPDSWSLSVTKKDFVKRDLENLYNKILTDVIDRTQGITEVESYFFDNCMGGESNKGLVSLLADAMSSESDLYFVIDRSLEIIRKATNDEQQQIKKDYESKSESSIGFFVSFKDYTKTKMAKIYSELSFNSLASINKQSNLSSAIQFKIAQLRASVSNGDMAAIEQQAVDMAKALSDGKDIALDSQDIIEIPSVDVSATKEAFLFSSEKIALHLGMPLSYIVGARQGQSLNDSGEGDTKSVERGLRNYYRSIIKPILKKVFETDSVYKSQDFRQIQAGLSALQTFSITEEDLLNNSEKRIILESLFDLDSEQE